METERREEEKKKRKGRRESKGGKGREWNRTGGKGSFCASSHIYLTNHVKKLGTSLGHRNRYGLYKNKALSFHPLAWTLRQICKMTNVPCPTENNMGTAVGRDMPDRESKEEHRTALNFL